MNKFMLTALMTLPMAALAQGGFKIEGQVKKAPDNAKVYYYYTSNDGMQQSTAVVKKGKFSFEGNVTGPTLLTLRLAHKEGDSANNPNADIYALYVDNGVSKLVATDSIKHAVLSGATLGTEYVAYSKSLQKSKDGLAALDKEWYGSTDEQKKDGKLAEKLRGIAKPLAEEKEKIQREYIQKNPTSYFSLLALQDLSSSAFDVDKVEPIFNKFAPEVKSSAAGVAFAKRITAAKSTAIGAIAPDFTQNDVNDKPVKLSDFRGKYVLIDFWASWCGPCRQENPNVVAAYHAFKDKNFTVLGVSLDNPGKKDNWLKAIADDKLEWTNVSDLQGWKNEASTLYGVRGIPQNYLIGPDGKIVASNLRGEKLHEKLAELLN